ncbi:MAG: PepSY-associated helix protein [Chlorobi bacterium]|nr:PepSY-associated helix protein [Chlorobiota bacterium]
MNRKFFAIHSWLGLIGGIFILILTMAGSLLLFAPEMEGDLPTVTNIRGGARLPLDTLVAAVRGRYPDGAISGFRSFPEREDRPYTIAMNRGGGLRMVLISPYSGEIIRLVDFEETLPRKLLALHRSLFNRPWGELFVALFGVVLLLSTITGAVFYRRAILNVFRHGFRLRPRHLIANVHTTVGVLALLFNLVMAGTGIYLIWPVFGRILGGEKRDARPAVVKGYGSIDSMVAESRRVLPGFQPTGVMFPQGKELLVRVMGTMAGTSVFLGEGSSSVTFTADGAVKESVDIGAAPFSVRLDKVIRAVHFGGRWPLPVRLLYLLGGLAPGVLSISGFFLWRRRNQRGERRADHLPVVLQPREEMVEQVIS